MVVLRGGYRYEGHEGLAGVLVPGPLPVGDHCLSYGYVVDGADAIDVPVKNILMYNIKFIFVTSL